MGVPKTPAPASASLREGWQGVIPAALLREVYPEQQLSNDTALGRTMNSSIGRILTFSLTVLVFILSAVGLAFWNAPQYRLAGSSWLLLGLTAMFIIIMYTLLPKLADLTGMQPRQTGWKTYLCMYRAAFLTAIPSLLFIALGFGRQVAFGVSAGKDITMSELEPASWNFFSATDGFVALNLTKGVVETLKRVEHGEEGIRRVSRFRDAELRINKEPFSDVPEPTTAPGMLAVYRIAPVFGFWSNCASRYRASTQCVYSNPVVAWAIASTDSLCSDLRTLACSSPKPMLEPVYNCGSDTPVYGIEAVDPIAGLCGRVVKPPAEGVMDELGRLLLIEGWPGDRLPNKSNVWVDVHQDPCISFPDECAAQWTTQGAIGLIFAALTITCIITPAIVDCRVDKQFRDALGFIEETKRVGRKVGTSVTV